MEAEHAANLLACLWPDPEAVSWKGVSCLIFVIAMCIQACACAKWPKYGITCDHWYHSFGLSTQYYILCSTVGWQPTTHSILHRSTLVDILKGDGNFSHTSSLIRLGPGYLLQPSRCPTDCRDLIMFTHSLKFPYRDKRMCQQDLKCNNLYLE